MLKDIFLTSFNQKTGRNLVLESNIHSLWAYLLAPNSKEVELDGFVCSLIQPVDSFELPIDKGLPPPLLRQYSNDFSFVKDLSEEQLQINWDNESVMVFVGTILYLVIDMNTKTSRSKSISIPCPYGLPL